MKRIDVTFTAHELADYDVDETGVIVVDILRASTTVVAALAAGASAIYPVSTPTAARRLKNAQAILIGGERGGYRLSGFDFGNSPGEYVPKRVADRLIILTSTNGTRAFLSASRAPEAVVGAYTNFTRTVEWMRDCSLDRIVISCAGSQSGASIAPEDVLFAGHLVEHLGDDWRRTPAAEIAKGYAQNKGHCLTDLLFNLPAGKRLSAMGLDDDVCWAGQWDRDEMLPTIRTLPGQTSGFDVLINAFENPEITS